MSTLRQAADEFLAQRRIAVAGVSRDASPIAGGFAGQPQERAAEIVNLQTA